MLKSTNQLETNKYELLITISAEDFEAANAKAFRDNSKRFNVPGFRKGKAPRHLIEKFYGESVCYEDALNASYPKAYDEAAAASGLKIVSKPELSVESCGKDGVEFKAVVWTKPEIELGEYRGIEAERPSDAVTDEEVNADIDRTRERNARLITLDAAAADGDIAVIDFEGFLDGKAFKGGSAKGHSLTLGSGSFIPGFEEQIVGHKAGDEFDITVSFPADYGAPELAGKTTVFKIVLHEVKHKEIPLLDDDFVKDVSDKDTVADYVASVRERLETAKKAQSDDAVDVAISEKLIGLVSGDIPECMFEDAIEDAVREFEYRIRMQGADLQTYLKYTNMTYEEFRKNFRSQAEARVKSRLALEKIAELEKFEVTDADVEEEFKKMEERYGEKAEKLREQISAEDLTEDIKVGKAVELVKAAAVIKPAAADEKKAPAKPKTAAKKTAKPKAESEDAADKPAEAVQDAAAPKAAKPKAAKPAAEKTETAAKAPAKKAPAKKKPADAE